MNSEKIVKSTLNISVPLNFVGAYLLAFPSSYAASLFGLPENVPLLYSFFLSFIVLFFGLAYAWLARKHNVFQPLLFVGGFLKIGLFFIGFILWLLGSASEEFIAVLICDLIIGTIWLWSLYLNRAKQKSV